MGFDPVNMDLSVELVSQALNHLDFLETVDKIPELKQRQIVKRSIYRYEKYWLPLAAAHPNECLSAPVDIEWVWHCHMLSPRAYVRDCEAIVGAVVNHTLRSTSDYKVALTKSCGFWTQLYQKDGEPFNIDYNASNDNLVTKFQSKIDYNIEEAASRQKSFYYQVSLPHYRDTKFLEASVVRYKKFIHLKQQLPNEFLVPCYDIDLVWHTHQLNPCAYKRDMIAHIGNLFNHDDTTTDRSQGSKLYLADKSTREHWKRVYDEGFAMFGAMYRGTPPEGVLYRISMAEVYGFSTKQCGVRVDNILIQLQKSIYKVKLRVLGQKLERSRGLMHIKKSGLSLTGHSKFAWSREELGAEGSFIFDSHDHTGLYFHLMKSIPVIKKNTIVSKGYFDLVSVVENPSNKDGGEININIPLGDGSIDGALIMNGHFEAPAKSNAYFYLEPGTYEKAVIPENVHVLWGPVALESLPSGVDNHCSVATHR